MRDTGEENENYMDNQMELNVYFKTKTSSSGMFLWKARNLLYPIHT